MSTHSTTDLSTPPPLPTPGTGGREEIPVEGPTSLRPATVARPRSVHGCAAAPGTPVGRYVAGMALLVAIWAMSGGGTFWPLWPMLGWGLFVVFGGGHGGGHGHRGRSSRPGHA